MCLYTACVYLGLMDKKFIYMIKMCDSRKGTPGGKSSDFIMCIHNVSQDDNMWDEMYVSLPSPHGEYIHHLFHMTF